MHQNDATRRKRDERRWKVVQIEVRNDGTLEISGYVNAVDRYSKELYSERGKFIEKVEPQVFQRALERAENVDMLLNHDVRHKLASTINQTLELREDNIGLFARAVINDKEVIKEAQQGNLKGWSFGFRTLNDTWEENEPISKRTLEDIELIEVSLLTIEPAYIATSVQVRAEGIEQRSRPDEQEEEPIFNEAYEKQKHLIDVWVWLMKNKTP